MTEQKLSPEGEKAQKFHNDIMGTLNNLYSRWLDEKEYEDIKDYQVPALVDAAKKHGVFISKMTKKPFGLIFTVNGAPFQAYVTTTRFGWKRLK
jgi:hypothetical protein